MTNEEENPAKKVTKILAEKIAKDLTKVNIKNLTGKIAKDLGEMVTKNLTRSGPCPVPCSARPLPGPLHTEHLKEKKAKEDTETYEEATNTLSVTFTVPFSFFCLRLPLLVGQASSSPFLDSAILGALSGIVSWYKRPVSAGSMKQHRS